MAEWREDYPESDRPDDDAMREIHWVQGGIPIARQILTKQDDDQWVLEPRECAFFDGRGVELCWWAWAQDKAEVSDRYARVAARMADELESAAAALRKVAETATKSAAMKGRSSKSAPRQGLA